LDFLEQFASVRSLLSPAEQYLSEVRMVSCMHSTWRLDAHAGSFKGHPRYGRRSSCQLGRREIVRRQLALRLGLNAQMCPGCAANPDSVRRLMDGIEANRGELFRLQEDQDREMKGYLTPVQHARYQMLRERFFRRLTEVRRERLERREGRPPVRPRRRRPRPRSPPAPTAA